MTRPPREFDDLLRHAAGPMDAATERRHIRAAQAGDATAMARLVTSNLRGIAVVAREVRGKTVVIPLPDALQEGVIAFEDAVRGYQEGRGELKTYAARLIKRAILAANSSYMPIRIDRRWLRRGWAERRDPGLRARAELALDCALEGELAGDRPGGREELYGGRTDPGYAEVDDRDERRREAETLRGWLDALDDRERRVVARRWGLDGGEGAIFAEIARELGVTRQWVEKIHARAMRRLGELAGMAGHPGTATTKVGG